MKKLLFVLAVMAIAGTAMADDSDYVDVTMTVAAYVNVTANGYTDQGQTAYDAQGKSSISGIAHFLVDANTIWTGTASMTGWYVHDANRGDGAIFQSIQDFLFMRDVWLADGTGPFTGQIVFSCITP